MAFDGEAFARSITTAAKSHIDRTIAPIVERLAKLEAQKPERGERGEAGERGAPGENGADGVGAADALIDRDGSLVLTFTDGRSKNLGVVMGKNGADGADGRPGRDGANGKDAPPVTREMILAAIASDPSIIADAVSAAVAKHFEANPIPVPKDGQDGRDGRDGKDGEPGARGEKGEQGDPGPKGEKGADGKDGRDGVEGPAGKDGRDGERGERGEKGETGAAGKDGLSVVKFLIDQSGELVGTFNDGSVERLGVVKGADGRDGANGRDGADGKDGRDGADGVGFDDMDVEYDGEKTITLSFRRGDVVKEARLTIPAVIFRGYWSEGSEHTAGDMVSWAGQVYVAKETTSSKPDDETAWSLVVKRGRDGRDFSPKEPQQKKQVKVG